MHGEEVRSVLDKVQDPVYRFCLMQLGREDCARDAAQETALRIIQQQECFKGNSKVTTWAIGIALNVCREWRRRQIKRDPTVELDELDHSGPSDSRLEAEDQVDQLKAAMQRLTERQRETLTLRYFEELSVSETAEILHMAEGTVKATTSQALKLLRRLIGSSREIS